MQPTTQHSSLTWALAVPLWLMSALGQPPIAAAVGRMTLGNKTLVAPQSSAGPCEAGDNAACARALTRLLSGYTLVPGEVGMELLSSSYEVLPSRRLVRGTVHGLGAALPGGKLNVLTFSARSATPQHLAVNMTLFDGSELFFCRDATDGRLYVPVLALASRSCRGDATLGVNATVLAAQYQTDPSTWMVDWLRVGPAVELLANGHSHAHLLRSVTLAPLVDLRTRSRGQDGSLGAPAIDATTFGANIRLSALWRTPVWEVDLLARFRTALMGLSTGTTGRQRELAVEVRVVRNFLWRDLLVTSIGLRASVDHAYGLQPAPWPWHNRVGGMVAGAGLVFGWRHAPPRI